MKPVKKSTSNHFKGNWQMQANLESDCCSGCVNYCTISLKTASLLTDWHLHL